MEEGEVQLNKVYGDPMVLLYRTQSTQAWSFLIVYEKGYAGWSQRH
jgi:hypothetical protein